MLTDFVRDHAFTIAWFGLMAFVWFGWGQEDPPPSWRWRLGLGSVIGVLIAALFGWSVARHWDDGSAMEGRYAWFGVLVAAEVILAAAGCIYLARAGRSRWMAWWVALIVAVHFAPLAWLLDDWSLALLAVLQIAALLAILSRLRDSERPTSRLVGPAMGGTLLLFAAISIAVYLARYGAPW